MDDELWERFAHFEAQSQPNSETHLDVLWTHDTRPSDVYASIPIMERVLNQLLGWWPVPPFAVMADSLVATSSSDQINLRWSGFALHPPVTLRSQLDVRWIESESLGSNAFTWRWTWQFRNRKLHKVAITVSSPKEPALAIADWTIDSSPIHIQTGLNPSGDEDVWVQQAGTPGRWISPTLLEIYQAMLDAQYAWWSTEQQQLSVKRLRRLASQSWLESGSGMFILSLAATTLALVFDMHGWSHTPWMMKLGFFAFPGLAGSAGYVALRRRVTQRVASFRKRVGGPPARTGERDAHLFH